MNRQCCESGIVIHSGPSVRRPRGARADVIRIPGRFKVARRVRLLLIGCAVLLLVAMLVAPAAQAATTLPVQAWDQHKIAGTPASGNSWCAATSLAQIANYYGSGLGLQASINLLTSGKLVGSSNGWLNAGARVRAKGVLGGTITLDGNDNGKPFNAVKMRAAIDAGYVLQGYSSSHTYTIVGYDASKGTGTTSFIIMDPADGSGPKPNTYAINGYYLFTGTPAPTNLKAVPTSTYSPTTILLTWKDNARTETGYVIQRLSGSTWVSGGVNTGPNATSRIWLGPAASTSYTFRVGAASSAGTSWAQEGSATVFTPPVITPSHWYVRVYNIDDTGTAYVNGTKVFEGGYKQDSGWRDVTSLFRTGSNQVRFTLYNQVQGYTWGFAVRKGDTIVWQDVQGQVGVWGANNNNQSLIFRMVYDGTYSFSN